MEGDQAVVPLSEDQAEKPSQEPLQNQWAGSLDESVLGAPLVALGGMNVVKV